MGKTNNFSRFEITGLITISFQILFLSRQLPVRSKLFVRVDRYFDKKSSLRPWKCLERQYLFFLFTLFHFTVIFALFWMWQNSPTLEQWNNCLILKLTLECFTLPAALSNWMWHSNSIQNKPKSFHIPIRKKCNDLTLFVLRYYILLS